MSGAMFAEAFENLLRDHGSPAFVRAVAAGAPASPLLQALREGGFQALLAEEGEGGAGLSWQEFFAIVLLFGSHAAPVPLAQTLAARALVAPGTPLPEGAVTFAPHVQEVSSGHLECANLPFALTADHVLAALGGRLVLLPVAGAQCERSGVHGRLAATLRWPAHAAQTLSARMPPEHLNAVGALLHAAMLAGAMRRCFDLTLAYTNTREQFGRAIGKNQAVQHQLAVMAEQVASARMAAEAAFQCGRGLPTLAACAVAKARASEAAQYVAATAHALHGAIGITAEYDLQLFTRRLHEWRLAHGSEDHWARELGQAFLGGDMLTVDFVRALGR
jgi:alkylation response protein AidB-like acyl-CoA dehydrogenase